MISFLNKHKFKIYIVSFYILLWGLYCGQNLRLGLIPTSTLNVIDIDVAYTTMLPNEADELITNIIESAVLNIDYVDSIQSYTTPNFSTTKAYISKDADIQKVKTKIVLSIRSLIPVLPINAQLPEVKTMTTTTGDINMNTTKIKIISNNSESRLEAINSIIKKLSKISGINEVDVVNMPKTQYLIDLDVAKMNKLGIDESDVLDQLKNFDFYSYLPSDEPIGNLNHQSHYIIKDTTGLSLNKFTSKYKTQVSLWEFANVSLNRENESATLRTNSKITTNINISFDSRSNIYKAARNVDEIVEIEKNASAKNVDLITESSVARYIKLEIQNSLVKALVSFLLSFLLLWITFRNYADLLKIIINMVLTVASVCITIFYLDLIIDSYAIISIAISIGLILDIFILALAHFKTQSVNLKFLPVILMCNFTTLLTFVVVFFLPQELQSIFYNFIVILILMLCFATIWCVILFPTFFKVNQDEVLTVNVHSMKPLTSFFTNKKQYLIPMLIIVFGIPLFLLPKEIPDNKLYQYTFGSEFYSSKMRPYLDKYLGGLLYQFYNNVYKQNATNKTSNFKITCSFSSPLSVLPDNLKSTIVRFENQLLELNKNNFFVFETKINSDNTGEITVIFPSSTEQNKVLKIYNILSSITDQVSNIDIVISTEGQGFSNHSAKNIENYRLEISGFDQNQLLRFGSKLGMLLNEHPKIDTIIFPKNMISSTQNSKQIVYSTLKDINPEEVKLAKKWLYEFDLNNKQVYTQNQKNIINVKKNKSSNIDFWYAKNEINQFNFDKYFFPTIKKESSYIFKKNQSYILYMDWLYKGNKKFGNKYRDNVLYKWTKTLPAGYSYKIIDLSLNFNSNFGTLNKYAWVFSISLFFIAFLIYFESIYYSILAFAIIPFSLIGCICAFVFTNSILTEGAYLAFLFIIGVSVNNTIIMLTEARRIDADISISYHQALSIKYKPILISTISSILSLVIFLFSDNKYSFWYSFSISMIFGLIWAFISLFIVLPLFIKKR